MNEEKILELIEGTNDYINGENSNKNPMLISTQRDYMAGEVSKEITMNRLLPEDIKTAHEQGIIHFHDSDYYVQKSINCCLCNLEDMLKKGTVITGTLIEYPHSFSTACNIATQIMAQIASNQYGGQSESLSHLAPFVNESRKRIRADVERELMDLRDRMSNDEFQKKAKEITESRVRKEIKKGVQTIQYQINTLMTTNGQTPFVTIYMYLGEVEEGRTRDDLALIIEEVIKQRYEGVKNEKGVWITPAFPKLVYVLEPDNINPDSKYYYLTRMAAQCSAKRLVPDYVSEKMLMKLKYPHDKLLNVQTRRDTWGDESIWGTNPFKNLTDEECRKLDTYIYDQIADRYERLGMSLVVTDDLKDLPAAREVIERERLTDRDLFPMAYSPMGCLRYNEKVELDSGTFEIGEIAEALRKLMQSKDKVQKVKDSENGRVLL